MSTTFVPVTTPEDQERLSELAGAIWREYWPERIGADQTEYMVEQFQSLGAIRRDMAKASEPYEYWFVVSDTVDGRGGEACAPRIVGYTGGHNEAATNRFFISKIYLLAQERGRGYASRVIDFYEGLCRERGLRAMYLTVNKYNELGIRAYEAKGFITIDATVSDIGQGFVMDDFIMEKQVEA
ncbi:MAG: GNAT family N-acetyltransferase [Eggerthellaceae bacterium]|nr:GNAT family N-acetyltransferase [Eggerthellaceae bacterium]